MEYIFRIDYRVNGKNEQKWGKPNKGSTGNPNKKVGNPNKKIKLFFSALSRKSKQKIPETQTKKSEIQVILW
jgi:hypothetical protein